MNYTCTWIKILSIIYINSRVVQEFGEQDVTKYDQMEII